MPASQAATYNLGILSYDLLIPGDGTLPGVAAFNIANLTFDPAAGGYALPPDFPVYSPIVFQQASLKIVTATASVMVELGDLPPGFFTAPELEFPDDSELLAAEFAATLSPATFSTSGSPAVVATSKDLRATLTARNRQMLIPGSDLVLIRTQARPMDGEVPEPVPSLLVASGVAFLLAVRLLSRI
jgi:hypothetical protein